MVLTELFSELATLPFLFVIAGVLLAGFLRGFVGFGAALVSVPIMTAAFGPLTAIPIVGLMGLPAVFQLLPTAIRDSETALVVPICLATLVGAPLGAWILVTVDPDIMKIVISGLVLLMVGLLSRGWSLGQEVGLPILLGAGLAGGVVQGSAGIGGPPVVAVALSRPGAASAQRGNVLAVMTAVSLSSVIPLWYHGLFTERTLLISLLMIPLYSGATWWGARYFSTQGQQHYRTVALAVLTAIGVVTLLVSIRDVWIVV